MSSVAGVYNCYYPHRHSCEGNPVSISETKGNRISGTYSRPVGCILDPHICNDICSDRYPKLLCGEPTGSSCQTIFKFNLRYGTDQYHSIRCIKENCTDKTVLEGIGIPALVPECSRDGIPTTRTSSRQPTTQISIESSNPTSFTVDTMATSATSSGSRDIGLLGTVVSKVKDTLSWINRLGTGSIPSQEVTTRDFTYDMQSKEVRSRISRSVWLRCAEVATDSFNNGKGYTTPLDVYRNNRC